jgi:hypothetical protein
MTIQGWKCLLLSLLRRGMCDLLLPPSIDLDPSRTSDTIGQLVMSHDTINIRDLPSPDMRAAFQRFRASLLQYRGLRLGNTSRTLCGAHNVSRIRSEILDILAEEAEPSCDGSHRHITRISHRARS